MSRRQRILLVTMLRSTSLINKRKYTKDAKVKSRTTSSFVGKGILFLMLVVYSFLTCFGYGMMGMAGLIPSTMTIAVSAFSFIFTVLKTNGYLFEFKEYDMLMSMPVETREIVADKFLYMYILNLPWMVGMSWSMMLGYIIFAKPGIVPVIMWIILSVILPLIPMVLASALGALIVAIGSRFKFKKLVQVILSFGIIIIAFGSRFFIEDVARNGKIEEVANTAKQAIEKAEKVYLPAAWFSDAVTNSRISSFLLIVAASIIIYEVFFIIVSRHYSTINSRLSAHASKGAYKVSKQKKRSVENAIAFKEFRRMLGSTNYLINAAMGQILTMVVVIVVAIIGMDKLISIITSGAPVSREMIIPGIPYIMFFMIGMMATTACTPSLEGKNYWIVQSLPIEKWTLYKGKMLFNMYLTVPFMLFGEIVFGLSCGVTPVVMLEFVILGFILCARSTVLGMVCGVKFMKLDWENEIEVVKQGTAVMVYLFPNMIFTMLMVVLLIAGAFRYSVLSLTAVVIVLETIVTIALFNWVKRLARE